MDTIDYNDLFIYKDGHIYNKIDINPRARKGQEAGSRRQDGYRHVGIKGKGIMNHRIIYEMHKGAIPKGLEIDHINRDRGDDRIENLRAVTRSVNQHNKPSVGVFMDKKAIARPYTAFIKNNQKFKHIGNYGTFCGAKMARMMYKLKLITLA